MNRRNLRLSTTSIVALASSLVLSAAVSAQAQNAIQPAPAASPTIAADRGATQLPEVVVTAQKRVQPLQKVPVSVEVVTGAALQGDNLTSLDDLGTVLPAVHIVETGGYGNSLNIRGIGSGAGNSAFDQSVAAFEDDIYYGRSRMIQSTFLDMDRVEVLKGPQSTFFGNNAIAGALNMVTAKPGDHFDGYFRALYGSYGTYAVEGAAGGPVTDQLGVRVAAIVNGDEGWIHNVYDDSKLAGGQANANARITAVYKPTSDLSVTLKVEGGQDKILGSTTPTPYQWQNCPPPAPLKTKTVNNQCPYALATPGEPFGLSNNLDAATPGQYSRLDTHAEVLTINYHQWGHTFTSVTGQYGYQFSQNADKSDTGPAIDTQHYQETYSQFSQEFRVASPTGQTIEYMAGVYYQSDTIHESGTGSTPFLTPTIEAYFGVPAADTPLGFRVGFNQNETIESIFGSSSWNVTDKLKFNLGVRGTSDEKDYVGSIAYGLTPTAYPTKLLPDPVALSPLQNYLIGANFLGAAGTYPYNRTDKAVMGNVGFQYQVEPQAMMYFTASRGFKAGGFNGIAPAGIGGIEPTFGPEYVNSYELGLKSKWLGNRLLINLDLFREDYTGLQVNSLVTLPGAANLKGIAFTNAGSAISQGVEFETQWLITHNFSLSADVTYLDAHYTSFPNASPNFLQSQNGVASQNLTGEPLDYAAKWSSSVTAEYKADLADNYRLVADVTPIFSSSYFNSNGTDDPLLRIKSSLRWDAKISLEQTSQHWAIDIIGKNLTNRVIVVEPDQSEDPGQKQEPMNISVQFRYKW